VTSLTGARAGVRGEPGGPDRRHPPHRAL